MNKFKAIMLSRHRLQWLAVVLLTLTSLGSGYYSYFIKPHRALIRDDGVAKWEQRMLSIREQLPPEAQEVGYISDDEFTALVQEYSLTRYALAPVIVRQGVEPEWIIGNFTEPGFEAILDERISSEYEIQGFGSGIYLIHRNRP